MLPAKGRKPYMNDAVDDYIQSVSPQPGDSPEALGRKLAKIACLIEPQAEDAEIAGQLLAIGANIDEKDAFGRTALLNASEAGNAPLVEKLLAKGANPHASDNRDEHLGPAICHAAYKQSVDVIKLLLQAGADANAVERPGGRSALVLAVDYGADAGGGPCPAVKALIEGGATPDIATHKGWTPVLYCFVREMPETAKYLIQQGADPELKTDIDTPYNMANRTYPEVAEVILDAIAKKREAERVEAENRQKMEQWIKDGCPTASPAATMRKLTLRPKP
jgi:hypothetical protein